MRRLLLALLIAVAGCTEGPSPQGSAEVARSACVGGSPAPGEAGGKIEAERARELVGAVADRVVAALATGSPEALVAFVHPDSGVRFSPYGYVDTQNDRVLDAGTLSSPDEAGQLHWGQFDGTGEPIDLTIREYFERFVYAVDFADAPELGFNTRIGKGNSLDNAPEVYPDGIRVEYHFPGFDAKYAGLDWRSLRLVFEHKNNCWYLTGIIHDQWTV